MSDDPANSQTIVPASAKAPPAAPVKVEDLVAAITGMNRFLTGFVQHPLFKEAKLGLPDWLILTVLLQTGGTNEADLAKKLGIAEQRIKQLSQALEKEQLVSIEQGVVSVTDAGKARLDELNTRLLPILENILAGNERAVIAIERQLRLLMRLTVSWKFEPARGS